jgi:hypothetical protein
MRLHVRTSNVLYRDLEISGSGLWSDQNLGRSEGTIPCCMTRASSTTTVHVAVRYQQNEDLPKKMFLDHLVREKT